MRKLARLLPYLAVLLLPLIALAVLLRAGPLAEHVRRVIESEFSRQLDREVSIASASVTLSGRVILRGVVVEDQDGSPLLEVPEVTARVGGEGSWLPILSGPADVREIKLVRPELSLRRDANGKLSIEDLLAREAEKPSRFQADVVVQDGRLVFMDESRGGVATVVEGADFTLRYPEPARSVFSLRARGVEGAFASLEMQGETDGETGEMSISGSISDLDIGYALARLPEMGVVSVSAGRADVQGKLVLGGPGAGDEAKYDVGVTVRDGEVRFPWLREAAKEVNGEVRFADGEVHLAGVAGRVGSALVSVEGVIANLQAPRLALEVSAYGISHSQLGTLAPTLALPPGLRLSSPLHITARVEGPVSDLRVTGKGRAPGIEFRGVLWNDVAASFEYSDGRLRLRDIRAHGSPRQVAGDLAVDWRAGRSRLQGNIELVDVPLPMLAQMAGIDGAGLSGTASVKASARSDGEQLLVGQFQVHEAVVKGLPLGSAEGEFELVGERLSIRRGVIKGPMGTGSLSAAASLGGAFEVEARFSSLDLGIIGAAIGRPEISGECAAELRASGNSRALSGSGWLDLGPGEVAGKAFRRLRARIDVSPARLQVSDLVLLIGEGEYRSDSLKLTNWLAGWERARMEGELEVKGAAVADWLPREYAAEAPEGRVDGEIAVSGTPIDPRLRLNLTLESLTVAGQPLTGGHVAVRYEDRRLTIEEMFFDDGSSRLEVSGGYDPEAGLALHVRADPLDLSRLASEARARYGLTIVGAVAATAEVTGPLAHPRVEFSLRSDELLVNQEKVEEFALSGCVDGESVQVDSGRAKIAGGDVSISGLVDLEARAVDVSLRLVDLDVGRLYAAGYLAVWRLERSGVRSPYFAAYAKVPHPLSGLVTADVRIEESLAEPRITAENLAFTGLGYAGRKIGRIEGEVALWLQLDGGSSPLREAEVSLVASDEMGDARISGGVTGEGEVSLVVDSLGYLDLNLLGPWLQYPMDLSGQATINFDISGPIKKPVLRGDIWVDQLRIGPFQAEQAMASPIFVKEGVLTMEEIRFTNPPEAGNPPTEATGKAAFPLFPGNGSSVGAQVTAPQAELHVKNGSIAFLPSLFDADIYLEGNKIILGKKEGPGASEPAPGITGRMGSGSFSIAGEIELRRPAPADWREHRFDVTFELEAAEIVIPGLASAKLDGTLWLTNAKPSAEERANQAAWAMLGGTLGALHPGMSIVTREMREQLHGSSPAVLKTREGNPLVVAEPTLVVPKLGALTKPDGAVSGPQVDITVRVGSIERMDEGVGKAADLPTKIVVDLGLLTVSGPASGMLELGGELSAEGYTLDGAVKARDGKVVFPNAVLTLRRGTVEVRRERGKEPEVRIADAEATGRVGDYNITLMPAGQVYPLEKTASSEGGAERLPPLPLNVTTIPYLDPAIAVTLLWGPVVTPTLGGVRSGEGLIQEPGRGGGGTGEITGVMLPTLGGSGAPELSLDVALQGPVQMRLGERLFSRILITYVSPVSGPEGTRALGVTYEVIPPLVSLGWSVDELERTRWELRAFRSF